MRSKWYLLLVMGIAILLISSVVGCGESYTQEDLDTAYEAGHAEGYDAGSHAGYKLGYAEGKGAGLAELESAIQEAEKIGYERGDAAGYDKGYEDGYRTGEDVGHDKGYQAGLEYGDFDWQAADFFLDIVSVTSPVSPGDYATLKAKTIPNAACYIGVFYESGRSEAEGLYPKFAGNQGNVSWTWRVDTRTTPGHWQIVVIAYSLGDWEYGVLSTLDTTYFEVQ